MKCGNFDSPAVDFFFVENCDIVVYSFAIVVD